MADPEAQVLYVGPDHCVAIHRNLMLTVAHQDPLPSFVRLLPGFLKRLRAQASAPLGFLVVLPPHNPPPGEEARVIIKDAFAIFSDVVAFGAFAVEKTGFTAAGQRSVLNLIMLAARPPFAMKVFGTVDEASRWIVTKQGKTPMQTVTELNGVVEWLKAGYLEGTLREPR